MGIFVGIFPLCIIKFIDIKCIMKDEVDKHAAISVDVGKW